MKAMYLGLGLGFALCLNSVNAEVYRWTDSDGQVHYSQMKPNEKPDAESLKIRTKYEKTQKDAKADPTQDTATDKSSESEKAEDLSKLSPEELRQRNCEKTKEYQASLQHDGDIAVTDEDGKLKTLSKDEREAKLKNATDLVEEYCAPKKAATPAKD